MSLYLFLVGPIAARLPGMKRGRRDHMCKKSPENRENGECVVFLVRAPLRNPFGLDRRSRRRYADEGQQAAPCPLGVSPGRAAAGRHRQSTMAGGFATSSLTNLRKAAQHLRAALGDEQGRLASVEGRLKLDLSGIWSDTLAFEAAIQAGELSEAAALYSAPLASRDVPDPAEEELDSLWIMLGSFCWTNSTW